MHSESDATKNTHLKKTFLKSQVVKGCGFIYFRKYSKNEPASSRPLESIMHFIFSTVWTKTSETHVTWAVSCH